MKLPHPLTSEQIELLQNDKAALDKALAEYDTQVGVVAGLKKTADELPQIIRQLEEEASFGTDSEAAIKLAGRREQQKMLLANIERKEELMRGGIFRALRDAANGGHWAHKLICRALVMHSEQQLTEMLAPYCESWERARQHALNLPAHQYLLPLMSEYLNIGKITDLLTAVYEAKSARTKLEDMIEGKDVIPDFCEVAAQAQSSHQEMTKMRRQSEALREKHALQSLELRDLREAKPINAGDFGGHPVANLG